MYRCKKYEGWFTLPAFDSYEGWFTLPAFDSYNTVICCLTRYFLILYLQAQDQIVAAENILSETKRINVSIKLARTLLPLLVICICSVKAIMAQ